MHFLDAAVVHSKSGIREQTGHESYTLPSDMSPITGPPGYTHICMHGLWNPDSENTALCPASNYMNSAPPYEIAHLVALRLPVGWLVHAQQKKTCYKSRNVTSRPYSVSSLRRACTRSAGSSGNKPPAAMKRLADV